MCRGALCYIGITLDTLTREFLFILFPPFRPRGSRTIARTTVLSDNRVSRGWSPNIVLQSYIVNLTRESLWRAIRPSACEAFSPTACSGQQQITEIICIETHYHHSVSTHAVSRPTPPAVTVTQSRNSGLKFGRMKDS